MKRLLLYCSLIPLASFVICFFFFKAVNQVDPFQKRLKVVEYCSSNHEFNNIIFIGGSRVITHINPKTIDSLTGVKSQNVSIVDIGIVEYNMLLNKYLQQHPKPDMVIMNLDVNMFFTNGPLYNICDFVPYLSDTLIYNKLSPYKRGFRSKAYQYFYLLERIFASTDYAKSKLFNFKNELAALRDTAKTYSDFEPRTEEWSPGADMELKSKTTATYKEEGFGLLQQIIDRCKRDSIDLIFIYSPIYFEGKIFISNFNEIFNRIKSISNKNEIPFWDYSNLEIAKSKEYFYNYSHMNYKGAKVLSLQVGLDIKKRLEEKALKQKSN